MEAKPLSGKENEIATVKRDKLLDVFRRSVQVSVRDDVEIIDTIELEGTAGALSLFRVGENLFNLWLTGGDGVPIHEIDKGMLREIFDSQISILDGTGPLRTESDVLLRYQTFQGWDSRIGSGMEGSYDLVRDMGNHVIRKVTSDASFMMEFLSNARKMPVGNYMLSRLSTRGSRHVPAMLGMSYWDAKNGNMPWMRLTGHPTGTTPSFRTFLSRLKTITDEFVVLSGPRAKRYLLDLSMSDHDSFREAERIGSSLGELHGSLLMDDAASSSTRGRRNQISDLFHLSTFTMTDVGTTIGTGSYYLTELKRDFVRLLGDRSKVNLVTGRRLKSLKRPPGKAKVEGVDETALDIFRTHLIKNDRMLRARLGLIRSFRSSPSLPAAMDCRLERVEVDPEGHHIFSGFDWDLYGVGEGKLVKFLPLKDLAMVLNSFMKARYLTARRAFRSMGTKSDPQPFNYLFLEYNLSKGSYTEMMRDFNTMGTFEGKEIPFSYVQKISLVTALWFDRARNSLVGGYVRKLSEMGHDELLSYPERADTIKGLRMIQSLIGLSEALRVLGSGRVLSPAGLESDLLCALSV
ncbi:MAG: hypothetical protein U9R75_04830 [Candidatus Thermoplasmatota archaeon]|nr:hypothetical protein [Candidatus Thermoplasmatota archaeon]